LIRLPLIKSSNTDTPAALDQCNHQVRHHKHRAPGHEYLLTFPGSAPHFHGRYPP
jgi:hypothetical protein